MLCLASALTATSGSYSAKLYSPEADIGPFAARMYRGVYRYVAERAVVHVGMVDDRFAVAAVGRRSLEHGAGLADHGCYPSIAFWAVACCGWRRTARLCMTVWLSL
jgi:hypothetical protein